MTEPVRIAGAGPAGLAAAIALARGGRAVEVFERGADCGTRFHGDLQGLENWTSSSDVLADLRARGLEPDFLCRPFRAVSHTNGRRTLSLRFDRPAFYLVKRGRANDSLDQGLKRQALAAGVTFRWRQVLAPGEADIVATGPDVRKPFAVDKGIAFETDAPDTALVLTHDRAAVKGYSYLLVAGGYGCLCSCLFDRFAEAGACFAHARRALLSHSDMKIGNPRPVGGLGHYSGRERFQEGRTRFAGEAAGLQDLLWGFGIRTALASGHLAARSILEGFDYAAAAAALLRPSQRAGVVNRVLWEALRHGNYIVLMHILARGGLGLLHSFYRFNALQRVLYAPARMISRRRYPVLDF